MKRVVVIGWTKKSSKDDRFSLMFIAGQLYTAGKTELAHLLRDQLINNQLDVYDMATRPEKGDAMDHLGADVVMVIALHLYGIDKMPVKGRELHKQLAEYGDENAQAAYCRDNFYLLERCMTLGIPLVAFGDQPWYKAQKVVDFATGFCPARCFLYEPTDTVGRVIQAL
jgi:hypothetical protein